APCPTPDERLLLSLIGAAQAGDEALLHAHLCWLARADARATVALTTRALAVALAAHGQWLRPPNSCHYGPLQGSEPGTHEHGQAPTWQRPCSWVPDSKARTPVKPGLT